MIADSEYNKRIDLNRRFIESRGMHKNVVQNYFVEENG